MRISDWSSDVCSSDLVCLITSYQRKRALKAPAICFVRVIDAVFRRCLQEPLHLVLEQALLHLLVVLCRELRLGLLRDDSLALAGQSVVEFGVVRSFQQIGRASWRERVCQYVLISVRAV